MDIWNLLRERLHFPGGVDRDELVIDSHVQDLFEGAEFPIYGGWRHELSFASLLQFLGATGLEVLNHAPSDLIEESVLEQLQKGLETVVVQIDRILSQGFLDSFEERLHIFPKQWWLFEGVRSPAFVREAAALFLCFLPDRQLHFPAGIVEDVGIFSFDGDLCL